MCKNGEMKAVEPYLKAQSWQNVKRPAVSRSPRSKKERKNRTGCLNGGFNTKEKPIG